MPINEQDIAQLTSGYGTLLQAMSQLTDQISEMEQRISARDQLIRDQGQEIFKLKLELDKQTKTIKTLQEYFFKVESIAIDTAFKQEMHGQVSESLAKIHPLPESTLTKIQQISAEQQKALALVYGPKTLTNNQQTLALTYQQPLELSDAQASEPFEDQTPRSAVNFSVSSEEKRNNNELSNEDRILEIERMIAMHSGDPRINQEHVEHQKSIPSPKSSEPVRQEAIVTVHAKQANSGRKKNRLPKINSPQVVTEKN